MRIVVLSLFILLMTFNKTYSATRHTIKNILIVMAMKEEADPVIKLLHLSPLPALDPHLPMKAFTGHYANLNIELILNGKDPMYGVQNVGSQAAVLATYLGISHFHPDIIMSIGTAGGQRDKGVKIGKVYISNRIYFYDRRYPFPDYKLYGVGDYHSMDTQLLQKKLNIQSGTVCTGDSFSEDKTDTSIIIKEGCMIIDMEAAGVSWVSMLTKTPMFAMKGVTNFVGRNSEQEFDKNYVSMTKKLALTTRDALDLLSLPSLPLS